MALLDKVKDFIGLHHYIVKYAKELTYDLRDSFRKTAFVPEIFNTPGTQEIYVGFSYKSNVLFKRRIYIIDEEIMLGLDTIIIGEKHAKNMRNQFDETLFDEIQPHLELHKVKHLQRLVDDLYEMRQSQKAKR